MIGTVRQVGGEKSYYLNGVAVTQEMYDAYFPSLLFPKPTKFSREDIELFVRMHDEDQIDPEMKKRLPRGYPIKSVALATTPKGVKRAMQEAERRGVPTEYTPDGACVLRDPAHRRAFLKAFHIHDRNSFNGH